MQRKYNMALQHFYQAATHTTDDPNAAVKAKLKDLSDSEEELYISERYKQECFEMKDLKENDSADPDHNDNFFQFRKELHVKRVKPERICSKKGCFMLCAWFVIFTVSMVGLTYFIQLAISLIHPKHSVYQNKPIVFERYNETKPSREDSLQSCSDFEVKRVWDIEYDKFQTESAIRLVDVNKDGIDDTIMGFVTKYDGAHNMGEGRETCNQYFHGQYPCFGGVVANDGATGKQLWLHFTAHEVYAVNCNGDINSDGIPDCLCAGRGGVFEAVSGMNGNLIWMFLDKSYLNENMNLYTPQFIYDIDHDGVMDVLQIHGGDPMAEPFSESRLPGRIIFFSGKTGLVIKSVTVPDNQESYFSPLVYLNKNGTQMVVFGTGGETHTGSLYVVKLKDLLKADFRNARKLLANSKKGFMNPPVLVDINKDGVVDLVSAGFAGGLIAVDGNNYKRLWSFQRSSVETYSIPATGYFNGDDIVDFLVRINHGPGFPVYFYSKIFVLDGKTGQPILEEGYKTSAAVHSSPLSVSMEGSGNDLFLYWIADCKGHEHEGGEFEYVPGTNVHESSRYDSCLARFGTKSFSKFYVTNKKLGFPGKSVYYSEDELADKRHIGIPDHGGVQRILQTGAVATSLDTGNPNDLRDKFDIIFATYYIEPSHVRAILPEDKKCIEEYRQKATEGRVLNEVDKVENQKLGFTDEGDTAINNCIAHNLTNKDSDTKYEKLTLHRFQVTCKCHRNSRCARVLPQREQGWSGYLGSLNNGYFNKRPAVRLNV